MMDERKASYPRVLGEYVRQSFSFAFTWIALAMEIAGLIQTMKAPNSPFIPVVVWRIGGLVVFLIAQIAIFVRLWRRNEQLQQRIDEGKGKAKWEDELLQFQRALDSFSVQVDRAYKRFVLVEKHPARWDRLAQDSPWPERVSVSRSLGDYEPAPRPLILEFALRIYLPPKGERDASDWRDRPSLILRAELEAFHDSFQNLKHWFYVWGEEVRAAKDFRTFCRDRIIKPHDHLIRLAFYLEVALARAINHGKPPAQFGLLWLLSECRSNFVLDTSTESGREVGNALRQAHASVG